MKTIWQELNLHRPQAWRAVITDVQRDDYVPGGVYTDKKASNADRNVFMKMKFDIGPNYAEGTKLGVEAQPYHVEQKGDIELPTRQLLTDVHQFDLYIHDNVGRYAAAHKEFGQQQADEMALRQYQKLGYLSFKENYIGAAYGCLEHALLGQYMAQLRGYECYMIYGDVTWERDWATMKHTMVLIFGKDGRAYLWDTRNQENSNDPRDKDNALSTLYPLPEKLARDFFLKPKSNRSFLELRSLYGENNCWFGFGEQDIVRSEQICDNNHRLVSQMKRRMLRLYEQRRAADVGPIILRPQDLQPE